MIFCQKTNEQNRFEKKVYELLEIDIKIINRLYFCAISQLPTMHFIKCLLMDI
jgi:hypothetical protein